MSAVDSPVPFLGEMNVQIAGPLWYNQQDKTSRKGHEHDDEGFICLPRQDCTATPETTIFRDLRVGNSPIYYQFTTWVWVSTRYINLRPQAWERQQSRRIATARTNRWPRLIPGPDIAPRLHPWRATQLPAKKSGSLLNNKNERLMILNFISRLVILFFHQFIHGDIQCFGNLVERNQRNMVSVFCALNLA